MIRINSERKFPTRPWDGRPGSLNSVVIWVRVATFITNIDGGPPNALSNGLPALFLWDESCRGLDLIFHLHLGSKFGFCGALPPRPNSCSWCVD